MKPKKWSDKDTVFYKKLFLLVLPIAFQQFMLAAVSASDAGICKSGFPFRSIAGRADYLCI